MADSRGTNIIITGLPHSGKSTLLDRIIALIQNKRGMVAVEEQQGGQRVGFEVITSLFQHARMAGVDIESPIKVGRYGVDINALESVLPPLHEFLPNEILYIDEIGQMQLHSRAFKNLVIKYLNAPNPALMTMTSVYTEPLIDEIRARDDITWFEITSENRPVAFRDIYTLVDQWQTLP